MILFEYEGKQLLKNAGIKVPNSRLLENNSSIPQEKNKILKPFDAQDKQVQDDKEQPHINPPCVLKAQVLSGKRAEAGGIIVVNSRDELRVQSEELFNKTVNKEKVERILVEEKVEVEKEFYVSLSYDTDSRAPLLTISESGGTGVENQKIQTFVIDPTSPFANLPSIVDPRTLSDLINLFFAQDCLLLEINPLVLTKSDEWMALDAKVKLDDTAFSRHPDWKFSARSVPGYTPSLREVEAKKIDEGDYRGTAGSTYFDLEGDIAILASGGGASLLAMDSLIKLEGKPANYTEYSGNPPKEKVEKLTQIVLSKQGINGLWIVGAIANFTDIYETLSGVVEALKQVQGDLGTKINYPIVIRRGGPRDKEAFEMLKKIKDFDLHLFGEETSIGESAKVMVELANKYKLKVQSAN